MKNLANGLAHMGLDVSGMSAEEIAADVAELAPEAQELREAIANLNSAEVAELAKAVERRLWGYR